MLAEQPDVFEQQVAEIGGVEDLQPLLIARIELAAFAVAEHGGFAGRHLRRHQAAVFPAIDQAGQHARRPPFVVDIFGLQQLLEEADLVIDVEHGEVGFQLHQLGMAAQDAPGDRVEGAEPRHAFDRLSEHLGETCLHLTRRLVGEGHRQDLAGARPALAQNMRDAGGEHAGLAGACPGQHQDRAIQRLDRVALLRIEAREIACAPRRGGTRTRGDTAGDGLVVRRRKGAHAVGLGHRRISLIPLPASYDGINGSAGGALIAGIDGYMGPIAAFYSPNSGQREGRLFRRFANF